MLGHKVPKIYTFKQNYEMSNDDALLDSNSMELKSSFLFYEISILYRTSTQHYEEGCERTPPLMMEGKVEGKRDGANIRLLV